ncbi:nSTAND1 domain-containing NTPase [Duganella radicis]|uniref:AAA family ATPase n=1 Tax=Duganella radicis TaxID=551988 RepID=A0A6L6PCQ6_9BURK|nr:winged helix-turn-helix domain-containing protein [Duganella radicis]MTV36307.1 AAA family ATPase [Duganella radicis]
MDSGRFLLGDWVVDVAAHRIERGDTVVVLEPRPMAVLVEFCRHSNEVLTADALLEACWPGQTYSDNPVHKVIAGLRRALQDSASTPRYIETIRKQGYRVIAPIRVLSDQGPRSLNGAWRGKSPFCGLEPFDTEHASVYFGRDAAVKKLHAHLEGQWERGHPLVVLLGPSGSGKTSLVRAGLVPAMLAGSATGSARLRACAVTTMDLGALDETGPWQALARALLDWEVAGTPILSGHSVASLTEVLRGQSDELLRQLQAGLRPQHDAGPPLLVLDRLEGLFQAAAGIDVLAFLNCVERLVRSRLMLVLAVCRNDFYPSLACHRLLMHDKEHGAHMDLAPPDADAITQMIRLPARAANLSYGYDASGLNRLDDRLCADAMQAGDALPLLQYTLQALYLKREPGNELTWAAYDELGGLEGAIGSRAEAILADLPGAQQNALARLLPRLVALSIEDASPTSRSVTGASLTDDNERALVHALVEARLLVADRVAGVIGFRVAHEALLRRWPRVTAWVAQHRVTLAAREELAPWVRRWQEGLRANALLLPRGTLLWQSGSAVAAVPHLFSGEEQDFVARSLARIKSQTRWRWAASAGAVALAVVAGVAAVRNAQLAKTVSARELQSRRLATFMFGELADQLRPVGKLDLLNSIGEQGLKLLSPTDSRDELAVDTLQRAKALVVIGEVNSTRGKNHIETATVALVRAYDLLVSMGKAPGVDPGEYYKTLGASAFWLGQIAYDAGRMDEASKQMARYREASEQWLRAAPGNPQARAELGYALSSLSSIAMKRAAWDEARRGFEASLALKLAVLADHPGDVEALDAIASARTWLGQLAHIQGQPTQALALYDAAHAVQLRLMTERPGESVRLRDLGVLELRRAEALHALGRGADTVQARQAAVLWLEKATVNGVNNVYWQAERLLAESALLLAKVEAGVSVDQRAALLRRQLAAQNNTKQANLQMRQFAIVQVGLADAEWAAARNDWPAAHDGASAALRELGTLMARQPYLWQGRELQAHAGLLLMRGPAGATAAPSVAEQCASTRETLQPAIDSGQAGIVLEAWLAARVCAGGAAVARTELHQLTAGGYRPRSIQFLTQFKQGATP